MNVYMTLQELPQEEGLGRNIEKNREPEAKMPKAMMTTSGTRYAG